MIEGSGVRGQGSVDTELATTVSTGVLDVKEAVQRRLVPVRWPLTADRTAAVGLLLAALLFYYPLVFLGRAMVDYDAFVYFYPQRVYLAQALLAGRIPLWDPDLFLGVPFLANPQTAVLYPFSWLFVGSSRVDLQACKLEYSIVSPK